MEIDDITFIIIEESIYIHRELGPGLLESVYEEILCYRLRKRGFFIEQQKAIPVFFEGVSMEIAFRADIIVENKVIVELKSVEEISKVHFRKLVTYLRLTDLKVALMINFYVEVLKDGIRRIVNNY